MRQISLALACVLVLFTVVAGAHQSGPAGNSQDDGWTALKERRFADALEWFTRAAGADRRNPHLHFGAGVAAYMLGNTAEATERFERVLTLTPGYTDASLLLAELRHQEGNTREAIRIVDAALKHAPDHPELNEKLADWRKDTQLHDRFYQAQGSHFTVLFEGPADESLARRAVEMLEAAYWRIGGALSTYPAKPITVVLYTLKQFRDITQAPGWSAGVYDGRIRVPVKGALDTPEELERVLAHEFVHALIATISSHQLPIWINEGLATALEPGGREAAEAYLARHTSRLPHHLLHRSFRSLPPDAVGLAYAQSAVAVQRLLDLRGAPALVGLMSAVGRGIAFEAAFQQSIYMRYEDFETSLR